MGRFKLSNSGSLPSIPEFSKAAITARNGYSAAGSPAAQERYRGNDAPARIGEEVEMAEFKDRIPTGGGRVTYLYYPDGRRATQISGFMRAVFMVAVSLDGRHILGIIPATGIGQGAVYPQPSVTTYIQSDEQSMWGRICPFCHKYFRSTHFAGDTCCPYCAEAGPGLAFTTADQSAYVLACYDAFARSYMENKSTSVDEASVTDSKSAWHYSEVKQQFHFKCQTPKCGAETDIKGDGRAYCPRCGRSNGRKVFVDSMNKMLAELNETKANQVDEGARQGVWERMIKDSVTNLEALANHLRFKLLRLPMTPRRRKQVERESFQNPFQTDEALREWFDIGLMEWDGNDEAPKRRLPTDAAFVKKMFQKRNVLVHNNGVVNDEYLERSGDSEFSLGERIVVRDHEAKRFIETVRAMGENLLDGVEHGIQ